MVPVQNDFNPHIKTIKCKKTKPIVCIYIYVFSNVIISKDNSLIARSENTLAF